MDKNILLVTLITIHFIGSIISIIVHYKTGVFKDAAEHGDGIRIATPSDVVFQDLVFWEFVLLIDAFFVIETFVNRWFSKHYHLEKN